MSPERHSTKRLKKTMWQDHINEWKESGEKQAQFCRRKQISYTAFLYWRTKLLQEGQRTTSPLVPVQITQPVATHRSVYPPVKLQLPNGVSILIPGGADPDTVRLVLTTAGLSSC